MKNPYTPLPAETGAGADVTVEAGEGTPEAPLGAVPSRPRGEARTAAREVLLVVAGLVVYFGVRVVVQDGGGIQALANATAIIRFEEALHLAWEVPIQQWVLDRGTLIRLFNCVYIWGHWPVLIGSMGFLYLRHRQIYRKLRTSMVISGAIGLLIFLSFPVAPPRLANVGVSDTIALYDSTYQEVGGRSRFTNQYAAMPSFHFGWNLLAGLCMASAVRRKLLRAALVALPILMALAIAATGNHFIVDAAAGGALALLGLALSGTVLTRAGDKRGRPGEVPMLRPRQTAADQVSTAATPPQG